MKHYSSRYTSADDLVAVIKQRVELEGWTVNRYGGFSDPRIGIQLMISRGDAFSACGALVNPVHTLTTTQPAALGSMG